uniref:transmembrane protein 51-like n=1 Tax=Myxine glutinosa TaxID=7769 RepID=UPI00358F72D9
MASEGCLGVRYCLVVLGIGMLSLGILMVTWQSFVEEPITPNNESSGDFPGTSIAPPQTFNQPDFTTYAFCIAGSLLLAVGIIWSIYQNISGSPAAVDAHPAQSSENEETERYDAPRYEEVVQEGRVVGSVHNHSITEDVCLPSYDAIAVDIRTDPDVEQGRRNPRRVLSDSTALHRVMKLHVATVDRKAVSEPNFIEPLTPPPLYEDVLDIPLGLK